jgi:hypothetical protein
VIESGDHAVFSEAGPGERRDQGTRDQGDGVDHEVDRGQRGMPMDPREHQQQRGRDAGGDRSDEHAVERLARPIPPRHPRL